MEGAAGLGGANLGSASGHWCCGVVRAERKGGPVAKALVWHLVQFPTRPQTDSLGGCGLITEAQSSEGIQVPEPLGGMRFQLLNPLGVSTLSVTVPGNLYKPGPSSPVLGCPLTPMGLTALPRHLGG